jgi:hypothetical protein
VTGSRSGSLSERIRAATLRLAFGREPTPSRPSQEFVEFLERSSTISTMTYLAMDHVSLKKFSSVSVDEGSAAVQRALARSNRPTVIGGFRSSRTLGPNG